MTIEKQLRKYIMPNILAMIGTSCYILADTFFISVAEGADGIAALNLTLPVYGIIFAIGSMIGIGSAIRYSLCKATGDKKADHYFSNAILWQFIFGMMFLLLGLCCPQAILRLMGADDVILGIGIPYLRTALLFSPFFMINYAFTAFVRNDNAPRTAMLATLLSGIFNIVFDYVFMFPMGLGMVGAALATGVSPIVSILICLTHFFFGKNTIRFQMHLPSVSGLIEACRVGVVAFVGEMASGITTMAFNFILLDISGNTAVAAYGVIANIALVGTSIFNGITQGLQPMASEARGKGDRDMENRVLKHSLQIALVLAVVMVAVVWIFAKQAVAVFNSEGSAQMAEYAVLGLRLYYIGFIMASVNIIRAGFFSAIGFARESSMIAILRGIVAIVVFAFVLSKLFGMTGVWLAFPVTELFTFFVTRKLGKESRK